MSAPIDYSKWDNLKTSSDDELTQEDYNRPKQPKVTRFEKSQKVTFGGSENALIIEDGTTSAAVNASNKQHSLRSEVKKEPKGAESAFRDTTAYTLSKNRPQLLLTSALVKNGGVHHRRYFWKQDRYHVIAYIVVPPSLTHFRAKDVKICVHETSVSITANTQPSSESQSGRADEISQRPEQVSLLRGQFPYPVYDSEECISWELKSCNMHWETLYKFCEGWQVLVDSESSADLNLMHGKKSESENASPQVDSCILELSLVKKNDLDGVFVWWNCFIKGDTEIKVEVVPDRISQAARTHSASSSFQETWKEAHKRFKEKVADSRFAD